MNYKLQIFQCDSLSRLLTHSRMLCHTWAHLTLTPTFWASVASYITWSVASVFALHCGVILLPLKAHWLDSSSFGCCSLGKSWLMLELCQSYYLYPRYSTCLINHETQYTLTLHVVTIRIFVVHALSMGGHTLLLG